MLARIDALVDFTGQPTGSFSRRATGRSCRGQRNAAGDPGGRPGARRATERGRILVVDDNAANRDLLSRRLVRAGHDVVEAEGGAAALALLDQRDV